MSASEDHTERARRVQGVQPWATVFRDPRGGPARIALEQTTSNEFRLLVGFRYRGSDREFLVTPESLPATDLASVAPPFARSSAATARTRWLRSCTITSSSTAPGQEPPVSRIEADNIFKEALEYLDVPPIRRTLM